MSTIECSTFTDVLIGASDVVGGGTFIRIEFNGRTFSDHFPTRASAKEWGRDVLVAYADFHLTTATLLVNVAGCDCDGELHGRHCWWVVSHDDGREQVCD